MDHSKNLHIFFEAHVEKCPQQVAVMFNKKSLTYKELNERANKLAYYLINCGVKPDTLVAIFFERSIDFIIAVLGVLKAGGAYIPLDVSHPYERLSTILKDAENPILITSTLHEKKFINYEGPLKILNNNENIKNQPTHNPPSLIAPNNLAYVIYTSGSTGTPKGVLIEHGSVINYALWFSQQCEGVDRIDFSSNPAFDMAVSLYLVPLVLGLTIVICKDSIKKDPRNYLNYINENDLNFIKITPSYFKVLVNESGHTPIKLSQLKKIMLGGENLAKAECKSWLDMYPHHTLYNEYGPTEATVAVSVFKINRNNIDGLAENVPIGALAPNTYAYILDEELSPVSIGEVGELYLGGTCLARGYLNNHDSTQKYFIKDPFNAKNNHTLYKTGDLCRRLAESDLECIGRIDHQLKIRGFRVEPDEIKTHLDAHKAIHASVVVATDSKQNETSLIAYYILKDSTIELQSSELIHYLKRYLPEYMIPAAFIRMDSFPLNANDKLDRSSLPTPQFSRSMNYVPPRTRLEKKLAHIWSEELGVSTIGTQDDFFELGGHSLSAARIISKINADLRKEITLPDFYASLTIASLIPVIKRTKAIKNTQLMLAKKLQNDSALFPLSDFQLMLWMGHTFEPKTTKLNIVTRKCFQGRIDISKLNVAFEVLLYKHEVLSYHVSKFRLGQYLINHPPFVIIEESLDVLTDDEKKIALEKSIYDLVHYSSWSTNIPQIIIRLFHIQENRSELHLCIPHIISDDVSPDILLSDLSKFYETGTTLNKNVQKDSSYRNYLLDEQIYLKKYLDRDINFWNTYLKEAFLCPFPTEHVVNDTQTHDYSSYLEIPEKNLTMFKSFCAKNHISLSDGLSAVVLLALKNHIIMDDDSSICVNRVKSMRDSHDYDRTFGCFLRIEPIKLIVRKSASFSTLAQDIHNAVINTSLYQGCPNLVKLASIGSFRKKKIIKHSLINTFFWLYCLIFGTQLHYKILKFVGRLDAIKGNNYLININVQSNFLSRIQENEMSIFGFKKETVPTFEYDLLKINNLFDVSFMRTNDSKNPFLVISANLSSHYRERIASEMLKIMSDEISMVT